MKTGRLESLHRIVFPSATGRGDEPASRINEVRKQRIELGGVPATAGQKNWHFAFVRNEGGDRSLRMKNNGRVMSFKIDGDLSPEEFAAGGKLPLSRMGDMGEKEFLSGGDVVSKGVMQVHKSAPGLIHATFQDGRSNSTLTFAEEDGGRWSMTPVKPKRRLADLAPKFIAASSPDAVKRASDEKKVIAVDLDGTLAMHEGGDFDASKVGPPVPGMMKKVRSWIDEGHEVRIFTARASDKKNIPVIKEWLESHGLGGLVITNEKTPDVTEIWDDRAVQVKRNEGKKAAAASADKEEEQKKKRKAPYSQVKAILPWIAGGGLVGAGASEALRRKVFTNEFEGYLSDFDRKVKSDPFFQPYANLPKDEQIIQQLGDYALQGNRFLKHRFLGLVSPTGFIKAVRSSPLASKDEKWNEHSQQHYDTFEASPMSGFIRILGETTRPWPRADGQPGTTSLVSDRVRDAIRSSTNRLVGKNYVDASGGSPTWDFPAISMPSRLSDQEQIKAIRSLGPELKKEVLSSGGEGQKDWEEYVKNLENGKNLVYNAYGKITGFFNDLNSNWKNVSSGLAGTGIAALGGLGLWKFLDERHKKKLREARERNEGKTADWRSFVPSWVRPKPPVAKAPPVVPKKPLVSIDDMEADFASVTGGTVPPPEPPSLRTPSPLSMGAGGGHGIPQFPPQQNRVPATPRPMGPIMAKSGGCSPFVLSLKKKAQSEPGDLKVEHYFPAGSEESVRRLGLEKNEGLYAPNVPHLQIPKTIDPKYLDFGDNGVKLASICRHYKVAIGLNDVIKAPYNAVRSIHSRVNPDGDPASSSIVNKIKARVPESNLTKAIPPRSFHMPRMTRQWAQDSSSSRPNLPPASPVYGGGSDITVQGEAGGQPQTFRAPTLSSVVPGWYKARTYGNKFIPELNKARNYLDSNKIDTGTGNLPGDWSTPALVKHQTVGGEYGGGGAASILGDEKLIWMNKPHEAIAGSTDILRHESYHNALEKPIHINDNLFQINRENRQFFDKARGRVPWQSRIVPDPSRNDLERRLLHHDVAPAEMRNYMSRLQEHMFENRGSRIESPEQYDQFLKEIPFGGTDKGFEEAIKGYPYDPARMFRQMKKVHDLNPQSFNDIIEWQRQQIPGIVQNGAGGGYSKMASVSSYLKILRDRFMSAREKVNTSPTKAQIEAGNYRKGHVFMQGLDITIESPKGSTRSGTNKEGKKWSVTMKNDYGYIRNHPRSEADGDHVDVFVGPHPSSEIVFIVDQDVGGKFDEHKCMCGFLTEKEAKDAYLANFDENWKGFRSITSLTMKQFKQWLQKGDTSKPLAGQQMADFAKHAGAVSNVVNLLNKGTRYVAKVPEGEKFFSRPLPAAGRLARIGFNPYLGRHGWIPRAAVSATIVAPPVIEGVSYYNRMRDEARKHLDSMRSLERFLPAQGTAMKDVEEGLETFANSPLKWVRGLFTNSGNPVQEVADSLVVRGIGDKMYDSVRSLGSFHPSKWQDYALAALRPAMKPVIAATTDNLIPPRQKETPQSIAEIVTEAARRTKSPDMIPKKGGMEPQVEAKDGHKLPLPGFMQAVVDSPFISDGTVAIGSGALRGTAAAAVIHALRRGKREILDESKRDLELKKDLLLGAAIGAGTGAILHATPPVAQFLYDTFDKQGEIEDAMNTRKISKLQVMFKGGKHIMDVPLAPLTMGGAAAPLVGAGYGAIVGGVKGVGRKIKKKFTGEEDDPDEISKAVIEGATGGSQVGLMVAMQGKNPYSSRNKGGLPVRNRPGSPIVMRTKR